MADQWLQLRTVDVVPGCPHLLDRRTHASARDDDGGFIARVECAHERIQRGASGCGVGHSIARAGSWRSYRRRFVHRSGSVRDPLRVRQ